MAIWHQNIDNSSLRILRLTIRITNSSGHAMICMLLYELTTFVIVCIKQIIVITALNIMKAQEGFADTKGVIRISKSKNQISGK